MPTYQYACTACGHRFEAVQAFTDASLSECPECAGRLRKLFGSVGVEFKGSGFYRNDIRADAKSTKSTSSATASSDAGSSSGSSSTESTSTSTKSKPESTKSTATTSTTTAKAS